MSSGHARLSPSNLRWPICPGSVREEEPYHDIAGDAAIDGTGSHLLLELCMTNEVEAESYVGYIIGTEHEDMPAGWVVEQDRAERVQMCLNYVKRRVAELSETYPNDEIEVQAESKSNPGALIGRDDWSGTADVTIIVTDPTHGIVFVEVIDYKDGRGFVSVPGNTQLTSYLIGKIGEKVKTHNFPCRVGVVQPKTTPVVRYEDTNSQIAYEKLLELEVRAKATDDPNALLISGKHCRWCKHKPNCTADSEVGVETLKDIMPTVQGTSLAEVVEQTFAGVDALPSDKLAALVDVKKSIIAAFGKAEVEVMKRLKDGQQVPGYVIGTGNNKRVWNKKPEEIAKILKARRLKNDQVWSTEIISPAKLEKLDDLTKVQKEKIIGEYVAVVSGKPTLKQVDKPNPKTKALDFFGDVAEKPTTPSFL